MDISARYLGLELRNPLVASASPLASTVDGVRRLAEAGVAAVVLPSLFEEEIRRQAMQDAARALRELAERLEALQVGNARAHGWSWAEIAFFLGVSRQAVHKKHVGRVPPG